jgi:hypothetical protein
LPPNRHFDAADRRTTGAVTVAATTLAIRVIRRETELSLQAMEQAGML